MMIAIGLPTRPLFQRNPRTKVAATSSLMQSTLGLYRQLLRVSAAWPSRNRSKITEEIRAGICAH